MSLGEEGGSLSVCLSLSTERNLNEQIELRRLTFVDFGTEVKGEFFVWFTDVYVRVAFV